MNKKLWRVSKMLKLINNDRYSTIEKLENDFCNIYEKLLGHDNEYWSNNEEINEIYLKQDSSKLSKSDLNKAIDTYSQILDDIEEDERQSKISYDWEAYGDTYVQNTNQYCY